jgi:hypothetical protein
VISLHHLWLVAVDSKVLEKTISCSGLLLLVSDFAHLPLIFRVFIVAGALSMLRFFSKLVESVHLLDRLIFFIDEAVNIGEFWLLGSDNELSILILSESQII